MVDFGYETHWLRLERGNKNDDSRPVPAGVIQEPEWKIRSLTWKKVSTQVRQLKSVIARAKPDIIHAGPIHKVAFLAALGKIKPLISMSWGSDLLLDAKKSIITRWLCSYTLKRSQGFIGDCRVVHQAALDLGFIGEESAIFPWGIDLNLFHPEKRGFYRRQLGYENEILFLCTRSFETLYGVDHIIRAFGLMTKKRNDLRLFLMGDGTQRDKLIKLTSDLGLKDKIYFAGRKTNDELPPYYAACDFYLSASHSDGSSVSLMEALASGLPPIVSDIPANREWIKHGENGWLFVKGDENGLAELAISLLENPMLVQKVRENARKTAEKRADWNVNKMELKRLYDSTTHVENG